MKLIKIISFRINILFTVLFIFSVPFPYNFLPNTGNYLALFFESLIKYIGDTIFKLKQPYVSSIISDSTGMYIHVFVLLIISIIASFIWTYFSKSKSVTNLKHYNLFIIFISYYLALQLMIYGFDKIFKHQFYLPEPNILYTPLGFLSKDILYWSTMGSSYSYSVFSGLIELIAALFLLFKPTRLLGGIAAIAIMLNVVMINFGFDISVKIYSCFLLYLAIIISLPAIKKIIQLFVLNKSVEAEKIITSHSKQKKIIYGSLKLMIVAFMFYESLYVHVLTHNFNDDKALRPIFHGAYEVNFFIKNNDTLSHNLTNKELIKRFFIHRQGYFITQLMNDEMQDYKLNCNKADHTLTLTTFDESQIIFNYQQIAKDSVLILTTKIKNDSIKIHGKQIDLKKLRLISPQFHWTADAY